MYDTGDEALRVVTWGDILSLGEAPLVRVHSSCLASEVFEARDCDCADQLREAMKLMAHEGGGLIFHLHQEGRGQGLSNKIRAVHKMQAEDLDTAESFLALGLEQDIRDYQPAIAILSELGLSHVRLLSNNPRKRQALQKAGFRVTLVNTHPQVRAENEDYLQSKNDKLGHCIPLHQNTRSDQPVHFYHSDQMWGELSNFSQHAVFLRQRVWRTVEHFYQAQKFVTPSHQELVRQADSPMLAKETAQRIEPHDLRPDWSACKENVMFEGLQAKFTQHPELTELLLSTEDRLIAEHTANDLYWGDGGDGSGQNRLGVLLMRLRSQLMESRRNKERPCAD